MVSKQGTQAAVSENLDFGKYSLNTEGDRYRPTICRSEIAHQLFRLVRRTFPNNIFQEVCVGRRLWKNVLNGLLHDFARGKPAHRAERLASMRDQKGRGEHEENMGRLVT